MKRKTVAFSRKARNLFFHILTGCNLRCQHCYINPDQHGADMLPLPVIERWLTMFAGPGREGDTAANVIFLGGEPTLHPELPAAVRKARALGFQSITIDTNGYVFHDFLDRLTPDELDVVSFSLDGPDPEINDAIRGRGVYETCVANLRRAVAKGFSTSLIYTVNGHNIGALHRMPRLLADWGVERFFIQVIGIRGRSTASGPDWRVSREQWLSTVPVVAEQAARLGLIATFPRVFLGEGDVFECAGLCADNVFVFPNGRVYRCPLCEDYPIHAMEMGEHGVIPRSGITEQRLFSLDIPEGCVMNKLIQPDNLTYRPDGRPAYRVACCMLKDEIRPA